MKIGITERGDAAFDFSWYDKLVNQTPQYDAAVIITKNISSKFREKLLEAYYVFPRIILHAGCTGWGSSSIEPGAPDYKKQLENLKALIQNGFPKEQCVLRIDPIMPSQTGLKRVGDVLEEAERQLGTLSSLRIRISILDEYRHVKERLRQNGLKPLYGDFMQPPAYMLAAASKTLQQYAEKYGITFECCAEPGLSGNCFLHTGCISEKDLALFGIKPDTDKTNPQQRKGCLCLDGKTELLNGKRHPCPHGCVYCYWKD